VQPASCPKQAESLDGEKGAPAKGIPVRLDELLPRSFLVSLRRRLDASLSQDVRHRRPTDDGLVLAFMDLVMTGHETGRDCVAKHLEEATLVVAANAARGGAHPACNTIA
jgi:hypothetical protein